MKIAKLTPVLLALCLVQNGEAQKTLTDVSFPEIRHAHSANYVHTGEGYVSKQNLKKIVNGLSKREVYALIGVPHFSVGVFNVRKWDYVLYVFIPEYKKYVTCQYQIQFDNHARVTHTYWNTNECQNQALMGL